MPFLLDWCLHRLITMGNMSSLSVTGTMLGSGSAMLNTGMT